MDSTDDNAMGVGQTILSVPFCARLLLHSEDDEEGEDEEAVRSVFETTTPCRGVRREISLCYVDCRATEHMWVSCGRGSEY